MTMLPIECRTETDVHDRLLTMEIILLIGGSGPQQIDFDTVLKEQEIGVTTQLAISATEWRQVLADQNVVLVLARLDPTSHHEIDEALRWVRENISHLPFVVVGDSHERETAEHWLGAGVDEFIVSEEEWRLLPAVRRALRAAKLKARQQQSELREKQMVRLLTAVQDLSLAKDVATIQAIVRRAARDLTGADGATFVLKQDGDCYYADEDAIGPLWKGQSFPLSACISGWVMAHKKPVAIEDIYADPRVPVEAYRPTFVKSLLMVPIRTHDPIGAIGNYWAARRLAGQEEVDLLQALANTTAVAMENVQVYAELENRVRDRTRLLEQTNRELETFSYSVSHDLRSPITAILGFAQILSETLADGQVEELRGFCDRIIQHAHRMSGLIRDLLRLAKITQTELKFQPLNLSALASEALARFQESDRARVVRIAVSKDLMAHADPELTGIVLENLLSNAWKYTGLVPEAVIEFGGERQPQNGFVFFVRDNGAGFHPKDIRRLFAPFQRLHDPKQFPGVGVGLATVQRIIHKHGGRIWAEGEEGKGATFYFTLPTSISDVERSRAA